MTGNKYPGLLQSYFKRFLFELKADDSLFIPTEAIKPLSLNQTGDYLSVVRCAFYQCITDWLREKEITTRVDRTYAEFGKKRKSPMAQLSSFSSTERKDAIVVKKHMGLDDFLVLVRTR